MDPTGGTTADTRLLYGGVTMRTQLARTVCALLAQALHTMPVSLGHQDQEAAVFRADVSRARVDALVTENGRTVAGLAPSDFVVTENGNVRPLMLVSQGQTPIDVMIVLDMSASMRYSAEALAGAAGLAFASLRQGDRAGVMAFADKSQVVTMLTSDLGAVERCLQQLPMNAEFGGLTDIDGALEAVVDYLRKHVRQDRRRVAVMITDGGRACARCGSPARAIKGMLDVDAVLNTVVCHRAAVHLPSAPSRQAPTLGAPGRLPGARAPVPPDVEQIAALTGGESITTTDAGRTLREILDRARQRYELYYKPLPGRAGALRTVEVTLSSDARAAHPQARILARRQYVLREAVPD